MNVEIFRGAATEWNAAVAVLPGATASHLYGWKSVIEQVYQHDCPYLVARDHDRIVGLLPLVDVRSFAFGRYLVSMPFLNAGGPVGPDAVIRELTAAATELAVSRKARSLELRCTRELPIELTMHSEKVGCVLDLPEQTDQLWSGLGGKLRSQVRRPQKEGVEVRFGADQIAPFFQVFARNMRDLGSPTHSAQFFDVIARELGENVWFGCAYLKDQPIAAGCGLVYNGEFEITWASALREFNAVAPNMLLYWSFMERSVQHGLRIFNFGRSTPGSGPHRFKLQWGSRDVPLYWYRNASKADAAGPKADSGSMSLATRIWRRMPVPVATMIGGRLRGGIPA